MNATRKLEEDGLRQRHVAALARDLEALALAGDLAAAQLIAETIAGLMEPDAPAGPARGKVISLADRRRGGS
ncbi:MAG: hypothetical protein JWM10_3327 [Myxococcaceae bacterium]|nr:hypothetical protein [Myxococcaceae bacterium]